MTGKRPTHTHARSDGRATLSLILAPAVVDSDMAQVRSRSPGASGACSHAALKPEHRMMARRVAGARAVGDWNAAGSSDARRRAKTIGHLIADPAPSEQTWETLNIMQKELGDCFPTE